VLVLPLELGYVHAPKPRPCPRSSSGRT